MRAKADAVLPMQSWIARVLSGDLERVERQLAVNLPNHAAFRAAYDNQRTIEQCHALDIPAPRLLQVHEPGNIAVVKPRADVGAGLGVAICRGPEEMAYAIEACRPFGQPVVQEYIPGGVEAMRTVVLLFDRGSRLVGWFTTRKLRSRPATGGVTTLSVSTNDYELVSLVMPFFETWRWRGPAEVELKVDPRDGRAKVIEVNPRFPGYIGFAVHCGLHLPRLAAQAALGKVDPSGGYALGRKFVNPWLHVKAVAAELRCSHQKTRTLGHALREGWNAPWLALDGITDPLPRVGKMLAELRALYTGIPLGPDGADRFEPHPD
jgi:predicted ATP-grasp superfamily ATP-dependent carboligase